MRIALGTALYPMSQRPHLGTFVEALAGQWSRDGAAVTVIAPFPYWTPQTGRPVLKPGPTRGEETPEAPRVIRPGYATFSNVSLAGLSTRRLTHASFRRSFERAARRHLQGADAPDLLYGNHLFPAGDAVARFADRLGVPSFVALGESGDLLDEYERSFGTPRIRSALERATGVLAVSHETADRCTSRYAVDPAKLVVVPNAVDLEHFRPREQGAVRSVLGLPEDVPIVAFLGHFIDRKGPLRVLEALRRAPDARAIFLGHGPQQPEGEQVLHAERCPHALVPHYLCAADVFVLPTRSEGSPNAILEALACGLPVVSSDIPSVREVVSKSCAELVDPMDVRALGDAIAGLLDDAPRRATMSEAAREHASGFSLERRAQRILSWMSEARR